MISKEKYYIFYDGDCGFCNFWVQWTLKKDKKDNFLFVALQSNFGQIFLKERGLETNHFNTIYLWKPNTYYLIKSDAILKIAKIIGGKYSVLSAFKVFPRFLRNLCYNIISKNRTKIMAQSCLLPTSEEKKKFIN